ncbi:MULTISPECIES: alpha/beta fold hydrolase [unclassified Sphingopyxis]|uniref:alpha/beta fold hydrolase n=1 Tax=unclassified Sphingopyxis TaxID=2614943 RepID=UPI000730D62A|nr:MULTISPECIES: alpha/beta fold hydrolase [unclassified Sphingopyxis]KTE25043.1 flavin reductase [Sphingopyxis sp. H057]KTE53612.1 flavin reductase [Sphingopyxis sp. H073]KTE56205.1 flavin reductase [Sphingopyxis sp. H071]KTE61898.1 flavin reductase [Sphingopyxis sp. H107]KTE67171.1 flavin reductase [Sphingopyxis sp. H100]
MSVVEYRGFAGVRLEAEVIGADEDPSVLLIHGAGQTRRVWDSIANALQQAGRRVISLDLRGHGGSEWPEDGRYDFEAMVEDLRAVLAQLGTRPVVVASTLGGWIAAAALERDAAMLAAGLVLVDLPLNVDPAVSQKIGARLRDVAALAPGQAQWDIRMLGAFDAAAMTERLAGVAEHIALPTLYVRGAMSEIVSRRDAEAFVDRLPDGELVEVEDAALVVTDDRVDALGGHLIDFLERRAPRGSPEYRAGSDARTFRDALGCFATGVTVVTAFCPDGRPIGLTANSFTSVSLDPPLLLVCIANNAGSAPFLREAERFAVNVLQIGQQPTSNRFAGKGEDRFAATPWEVGEFGTPVLTGSLSSFECVRDAVHDGGDHFLLVGRVVKAIFEPRRDPLLYFRGKYRKLHFA